MKKIIAIAIAILAIACSSCADFKLGSVTTKFGEISQNSDGSYAVVIVEEGK
jgi:hypothetical protein